MSERGKGWEEAVWANKRMLVVEVCQARGNKAGGEFVDGEGANVEEFVYIKRPV